MSSSTSTTCLAPLMVKLIFVNGTLDKCADDFVQRLRSTLQRSVGFGVRRCCAALPFSPESQKRSRRCGTAPPQENAFSDGRSKEKRQKTTALQNLADHSRARLPRSVLECASPLALLLRPQSQRAAPLTMPRLVAKFSIALSSFALKNGGDKVNLSGPNYDDSARIEGAVMQSQMARVESRCLLTPDVWDCCHGGSIFRIPTHS